MIRITRGVPKYNIQIGPIHQAVNYNPTAILSVTDYFDESIVWHDKFHWIPINETTHNWGLLPFFAQKKLLDYYCLTVQVPLVFVGCSAGKHRSPMAVYSWLLSQPNATLESVAKEFYGKFDDDLTLKFNQDVKLNYIPKEILRMYKVMNECPNASFREILSNLSLDENISYFEDLWGVGKV